jgi:predicted ATPase
MADWMRKSSAVELRAWLPRWAWLVQLAELEDSTLLGNAVPAALDLQDQAATEPLALLLSYLRDKELQLVVDNGEHVLGAAAQPVTEVIHAAPGGACKRKVASPTERRAIDQSGRESELQSPICATTTNSGVESE